MNSIEDFLDELEQELRETGKKEISSAVVGERVINRLHDLDEIAYVRFASVYREFKDVNDFVQELKLMLENNRT
jgi:transcriptional repressor NrdR